MQTPKLSNALFRLAHSAHSYNLHAAGENSIPFLHRELAAESREPRCCGWWWSCGYCITCHLHATVLGSVIGCLSIGAEVPNWGALRHETAAQTVDNLIYWCDNWSYDMCIAIPFLSYGRTSKTGVLASRGIKMVSPFLRWSWKSGL